MLDTQDAVLEALRANDGQPYGRPRTVTAEELVAAAEQFDDTSLLIAALLDLMEAYEYDGEQRKSPVVFARILQLWDKDPEEFGEWATRQVFWRFKWVAAALLSVPDVPLAAVRRWHTEMRDRYRAAGHALQPYYAQRFHLAAHLGEDRPEDFELWAGRGRTSFSDCPACEIRAQAIHHAHGGDDARALEVWQPVFDGHRTCAEEPYTSHAHALLPLLRQGRTEEAVSSHLVGYRFARGKSSTAEQIGLHLEFCALSGNEARGLEILAENRDLFDGHGDPLARLEFLVGVELLTAGLADRGHRELDVSGPPGRNWTVGTLLAHVRSEASELADRFDARNGTDAVGARRRRRLAQRPLLAEPLALGVRAAAVQAAAPVAPADRPPVEPLPEDLRGLVLRARALRTTGHPDSDVLWHRVGELIGAEGYVHTEDPEIGSLDCLLAEVALQRAFDATEQDDLELARDEITRARARFEAAGQPDQELAVRARLLVLGLEQDGWAADWTALDAVLAESEELRAADPEAPAEGHLTVLQCHALAVHRELTSALPDPAPELTRRFDAVMARYRRESAAHGNSRRVATSHQYVADAHARQGLTDSAETELRTAKDLIEEAELPWLAPRVLVQLAQLGFLRGEPGDGVPLLHRALSEAARWGETSFPYGPTYALLGHACKHLGDTGGAIRALSEAAARFDRAEDGTEAAQVRLQLAEALRESGRLPDAVAVLESVLLASDVADLDERLRAQVRLDLARGLFTLGEHRAAAEEYLGLADAVAGWEDQDTHTMVAGEATVALAEAGLWEAAGTALERTLASHRTAPRTEQVLAVLREFARLTVAAQGQDGLPAALERLAEAERVREQAGQDGEELPFWQLDAALHYERARVNAMADQGEPALAAAELAIAAYQEGGAEGASARAEAVRLAALIEGRTLGRTDAARARLADGIQRCEQAGLAEEASELAAVRDRLAESS
ncbi:hypothetical protein KCMC57_up07020 [Kitasatospora sp. CMC57]|uniref:Tetratricopeptide repeat protein n=1 Tax=Kitasatospora sp. CMC57 TaxID=3231513 RepID=A0AB33JUS7_9ACTN